MHISTVNILEIVTDTENSIIIIKQKVNYVILFVIFSFGFDQF